MRIEVVAILLLALALVGCDVGMSGDRSQLGNSVIAEFVARNAGTGLQGLSRPDGKPMHEDFNSKVIERLLELARVGNLSNREVVVTQAVMMSQGELCRRYDDVTPQSGNCGPAHIPEYRWRSTDEVRSAALRLGFTCEKTSVRVLCSYRGVYVQHSVKFSILPSIDGVRDGPDMKYLEHGTLTTTVSLRPVFYIRETDLK
jgi:hypothetical protein